MIKAYIISIRWWFLSFFLSWKKGASLILMLIIIKSSLIIEKWIHLWICKRDLTSLFPNFSWDNSCSSYWCIKRTLRKVVAKKERGGCPLWLEAYTHTLDVPEIQSPSINISIQITILIIITIITVTNILHLLTQGYPSSSSSIRMIHEGHPWIETHHSDEHQDEAHYDSSDSHGLLSFDASDDACTKVLSHQQKDLLVTEGRHHIWWQPKHKRTLDLSTVIVRWRWLLWYRWQESKAYQHHHIISFWWLPPPVIIFININNSKPQQ